MATTTPDSIYYPSAGDQIAPLETVFATQASSIQAALSTTRAIKTYRWANASARTAQSGMQKYDRGYQSDTDTFYNYDGSTWVVENSGTQLMNWGTTGSPNWGPVTGKEPLFRMGQYQGTTTSGAIGVVTFPTPFPNGVSFVVLSPHRSSGTDTDAPPLIQETSVTKNGFQLFAPARPSSTIFVPWMAVGY